MKQLCLAPQPQRRNRKRRLLQAPNAPEERADVGHHGHFGGARPPKPADHGRGGVWRYDAADVLVVWGLLVLLDVFYFGVFLEFFFVFVFFFSFFFVFLGGFYLKKTSNKNPPGKGL